MPPRKNGQEFSQNEENNSRVGTELSSAEGINDEENLDTRNISNAVEEGDEDYDDEQLEDDELTEADFAGEEEDDDDEDIL
jgi:hypothetical protein